MDEQIKAQLEMLE